MGFLSPIKQTIINKDIEKRKYNKFRLNNSPTTFPSSCIVVNILLIRKTQLSALEIVNLS